MLPVHSVCHRCQICAQRLVIVSLRSSLRRNIRLRNEPFLFTVGFAG